MQYKLRTPVTREDLAPLRTGDTVLLSGAVYTARPPLQERTSPPCGPVTPCSCLGPSTPPGMPPTSG